METQKKPFNANMLLFFAFAIVFGICFCRVHMRVQTTLIGYELGRLKSNEAELLANRAQLQMSYAKLTSKDHLTLMANAQEPKKQLPSLAANP